MAKVMMVNLVIFVVAATHSNCYQTRDLVKI